MSDTFDLGIQETDPLRKFLRLLVCMADVDNATAVVIGTPQPGSSDTVVRVQINNAWEELPPYSRPMTEVAAELERMAAMSENRHEGIFEQTADGVHMCWKVQATKPGAEYVLTPISRREVPSGS